MSDMITPARVLRLAGLHGWELTEDQEQNALLTINEGITTAIPTDFSRYFTVLTVASALVVPGDKIDEIVRYSLEKHNHIYYGTIGVHQLPDGTLRVGCSVSMPAAAGADDAQLNHWLEVAIACAAEGLRDAVQALGLERYRAA
ncbi:hypothetical protein C1Y63_11575 [Corynebacterium sp. 13CS0277]|uniref:hypothetical protein n=1 Tax=Corynebacterium sp. 13CS0277 TaxID=2071994 RepID=UPI000D042B73|nr:hypothetical protein [Corynebacterium sp. 13CS0277]PRQ10435.1 hypothetical protein C1Y63_11575 [Corynebacterium sp. 13CS0277]